MSSDVLKSETLEELTEYFRKVSTFENGLNDKFNVKWTKIANNLVI